MSMKKTFDTQSMYKKIMPSVDLHTESNLSAVIGDENAADMAPPPAGMANSGGDGKESFGAQNLMAYIVRNKMNMVMEKMQCCSCEKCSAHIFTQVLNKLPPKYIAGGPKELEEAAEHCDEALGLEVTTSVLHEILALRRDPLH